VKSVYEIVARKEPHAERAQKEPFKVLEDIRFEFQRSD
jgi:hypothetical protein